MQRLTFLAPALHILGFNLLPEGPSSPPRYHHCFELLERETGHRLTDHLQVHTIEMRKFLKAAKTAPLSTNEAAWLYFLQHGNQLSAEQVQALGLPALVRANEELQVISQSRILRAQYEARMKAHRDALARKYEQQDFLTEARKEGLAKGLAQGLAKGERIGERKGLAKGLAKGKCAAKQEAILQVLTARGLAISARLRKQILACDDLRALERYLVRAATVSHAADLLED